VGRALVDRAILLRSGWFVGPIAGLRIRVVPHGLAVLGRLSYLFGRPCVTLTLRIDVLPARRARRLAWLIRRYSTFLLAGILATVGVMGRRLRRRPLVDRTRYMVLAGLLRLRMAGGTRPNGLLGTVPTTLPPHTLRLVHRFLLMNGFLFMHEFLLMNGFLLVHGFLLVRGTLSSWRFRRLPRTRSGPLGGSLFDRTLVSRTR
jgi:hypothetical protein